jgi:hypothetical protein
MGLRFCDLSPEGIVMAARLITLVFLAMVLPGLALARGRCPPETAEDQPILLRDPSIYEVVPGERGVDFSTPAYYWNMGTWFRMAHGYANPWIGPPNDRLRVDRNRYTEWLAATPLKGFDPATGKFNEALIPQVEKLPAEFAFWMPTLRLVERNRRKVRFQGRPGMSMWWPSTSTGPFVRAARPHMGLAPSGMLRSCLRWASRCHRAECRTLNILWMAQ